MSASVKALIAKQAATIVADGWEVGPTPHPCICGADRGEHSGAAGIGRCVRTDCKRYRADQVWEMVHKAIAADAMTLGDALREHDQRERAKHYRANPRGEGEWSIGASDTGTCPKKIEYRNRPPEGFEAAPEDNREARMGTIIHREVTRQMKAMFPWRLFEFKVRIPGLDRDSELDMYDPIMAVVTDFKTAGDWRWDQLNDDGPSWEVWEQVLLYGLALEEAGHRVETLRIVYVKRCNGHDEVHEMPYDRTAAEEARDRLLGYAEALDRGEPLPKTGTGPSTDALCRRCFARFDCWNIPLAERLGRSPENVTILGENPDEEAIIHAIATKVAASAKRLEAEKEEKIAKALVDGIPSGRYGANGEWEAYEQPQAGRPDYKASYERVLSYLDLPDGQRPKAEAVEPVKGRGWVNLKVGRTRKAVLDREKKAAKAKGA